MMSRYGGMRQIYHDPRRGRYSGRLPENDPDVIYSGFAPKGIVPETNSLVHFGDKAETDYSKAMGNARQEIGNV